METQIVFLWVPMDAENIPASTRPHTNRNCFPMLTLAPLRDRFPRPHTHTYLGCVPIWVQLSAGTKYTQPFQGIPLPSSHPIRLPLALPLRSRCISRHFQESSLFLEPSTMSITGLPHSSFQAFQNQT